MEKKLPEGWVNAELDQLAKVQSGGTPPRGNSRYWNGNIPWVKISDIKELYVSETDEYITSEGLDNSSARIFPKGTILFTIFATIGRIGVLEIDATTNQAIAGITPSEDVNSKYLTYSLLNLSIEIQGQGKGVAQKNINQSILKSTVIPLPPLPEQKRIAAKLDELFGYLDALKTKLDRIPALLKNFRQQVLTQAVTGKLTEEWRKGKGYSFNSKLDFDIPKEWQSDKLENHVESLKYGSSSKSLQEGEVPVLRMGNLQNGKIDWSDLKFSSDQNEIRKYWLESGDVLFNRTNSPELVGKTSIYKGEREAIYAGYLIRIKTKSGLSPEYLNFILNSNYSKKWCSEVKSDGVSQSNINAKKLAAFIIPLTTLQEQQEIVKRVEGLFAVADKIEAQYNSLKTKIDTLPKAILNKAFKGELVPQNPNDEPASVLLERIKGIKTGAKKGTKAYKEQETEVPIAAEPK